MMILIAGPFRSGTHDDPTRLALNLARLEDAAWPILKAGHIPMISQWVSAGVLRSANITGPAGPFAGQVSFVTAERLLEHCDAVLRLPGESTASDRQLALARERGLPVYTSLDQIPGYTPAVRAR